MKTNVTTVPISQADLSVLYEEIRSPSSWHWKVDVKTGWFAHHPESVEGQHVKAVLDGLRDAGQENEVQRLTTALESLRAVFSNDGHKEAADAISLVLEQSRIVATEKGYSIPDLPEDVYTEKSEENLMFPDGLSFACSQGGLLQSAREAVVHRMRVGKSDLDFYYLTRTAAIYFRENGHLFVAFDDDPEENILLVRMEEGKQAGSSWFVDIRDPLIANAILRAKTTRRVATVTGENVRTDAKAYTTIIGDIAQQYAPFIEKHRGRKLQTYVLKNDNCGKVTESNALIRCVWVGYDGFGNDLNANVSIGRACGVQKISTGNRGSLVSFVGLMYHRKYPGMFGSVEQMTAFFNNIEHRVKREQRNGLYGGLYDVLVITRTTQDIERFVAFFATYGHHNEWRKRPILLRYAFETYLHDQNHPKSLLDRLKSRREEKFKRAFLRHAYQRRFNEDITDEELSALPATALLTVIECNDIAPADIARARTAITNTKKGAHFPLDKIYYEQSAKGVRIEKMAADTVRQTVLDIISVTATVTGRWQARHNDAKERIAHLLNNPQKAQDLINFFQSCINQGAHYKDIANHHKKIQGSASKEEVVTTIDAIKNAAERNKYAQVDDTQYRSKMEPLSDILTMLKSQLDDTATAVTSVVIKTQRPAITDLVDYDTVHCCALFPFNNQDGAIGYLEDEHIILLQYFSKGKRGLLNIYGVIICVLCENDKGENVLLIDSAEGDENWLKVIKNWQTTYHDSIKQLAKDANCVGILYGNNVGNTVPKEFLKHIGTSLPLISTQLRKKNNTERYLETFKNGYSGNASGYYEKI